MYLGRWIVTEDNGAEMLECPECKARVIWREYKFAIGTKGTHFCPYCGADMWLNRQYSFFDDNVATPGKK